MNPAAARLPRTGMRPLRASLLVALLTLAGCSSSPEPPRILVLGLEGMDPCAVDRLMSEGKLPSFAKLRQGGAYGRLLSEEPMRSPTLWTTIATGKSPAENGIGALATVSAKTGEEIAATSRMRKAKALWNIFSKAGKRGDEKAAVAALEKAIELEPASALYRENLRRLQEGSKPAKSPAPR